jgi:hypothetical protein
MIAEQHCACSQSEHAVQPAHAMASGEIVQLPPLPPLLLATAPQMGVRPPPLLPLPLPLPLPLDVLPPLSAVSPLSPFDGVPLSSPMPLDEPLELPDADPLLIPDVLPLDEPPPIPESLPLPLPVPLEEPPMRGLRFPASGGVGSS